MDSDLGKVTKAGNHKIITQLMKPETVYSGRPVHIKTSIKAVKEVKSDKNIKETSQVKRHYSHRENCYVTRNFEKTPSYYECRAASAQCAHRNGYSSKLQCSCFINQFKARRTMQKQRLSLKLKSDGNIGLPNNTTERDEIVEMDTARNCNVPVL